MPELTLSMEAMQIIATAEDVILKQARKQILKEGGGSGPGQLSVQVMDLVEEEDKLTFMVAKGQLGLALGKGARNLQALKNVFNKEAKIIEFDEDLERFIRNCFKPHTVDSITIGTDDDSTAGAADDDEDGSDAAEGAPSGEADEKTAAAAFKVASRANVQTDGGKSDPSARFLVRVVIKPEDKGKAIGKAGRNINVIRALSRRHHNVVELKVE